MNFTPGHFARFTSKRSIAIVAGLFFANFVAIHYMATPGASGDFYARSKKNLQLNHPITIEDNDQNRKLIESKRGHEQYKHVLEQQEHNPIGNIFPWMARLSNKTFGGSNSEITHRDEKQVLGKFNKFGSDRKNNREILRDNVGEIVDGSKMEIAGKHVLDFSDNDHPDPESMATNKLDTGQLDNENVDVDQNVNKAFSEVQKNYKKADKADRKHITTNNDGTGHISAKQQADNSARQQADNLAQTEFAKVKNLGAENSEQLEIDLNCQDVSKPLPNQISWINSWQEMPLQNGKQMFLYRAYYDARPALQNTPSIRLYTVLPLYKFNGALFCFLWYDSEPKLVVNEAYKIENLSQNKKVFNINSKLHTQHVVTCSITDARQPIEVSLDIRYCQVPRVLLPVIYPEVLPTPLHDFAVCTVPQYGSMSTVDVPFFIEWMELNLLFGVTEISIYNSTLQLKGLAHNAVIYYQNKGVLKIEQHQSPIKSYSPKKEYDVSQLGLRSSLNDCLLRNSYRYKYVIVIDRDEVIVPKMHGSYSEMLDMIFKFDPDLETVPAISVRNAFFYRDYAEDTTIDSDLISMKYRTHRIPDDPSANGNFLPAKSFINPRTCMSAWNHHCLKPWTPKKFLKPQLALVHHYRSSCSAAGSLKDAQTLLKTRCQHLQNQTESDDFMLRFKDTLGQRVSQVLSSIS